MKRVRIVCRWPDQPAGTSPRVTILPTAAHCEVLLVGDDGSTEPLVGVSEVSFYAGLNEPPTAVIVVRGVEAEIECPADVQSDDAGRAAESGR